MTLSQDAFNAHVKVLKELFDVIGCDKGDDYATWNVNGTAEECIERLRKFHAEKTDKGCTLWDIPF